MKSKLWSVARPALILMLITAVSAAALAGVNALTAGTIARRAEETANQWWVFTRGGQWVDTACDATPIADGESYEFSIYAG